MDDHLRTSTNRDTDAGPADMTGLGPNAPVDALAALDRRSTEPDGIFRVLLVIAGAATGRSVLELIVALSKVSAGAPRQPPLRCRSSREGMCYPKPEPGHVLEPGVGDNAVRTLVGLTGLRGIRSAALRGGPTCGTIASCGV